jgi:hypothetical protein
MTAKWDVGEEKDGRAEKFKVTGLYPHAENYEFKTEQVFHIIKKYKRTVLVLCTMDSALQP